MRAEAIPLQALYSNTNKAFIIPDYQRPFAWDADRATNLLDAILEDSRKPEPETSIGTFLFCPISSKPGTSQFGNNTYESLAPEGLWEVVDGQQRLTVLALLGFALQRRQDALRKDGLRFTPPLEFQLMFGASRLARGRQVPLIIRDEDNFDLPWRSELARLLDGFLLGNRIPVSSTRLTEVLDRIEEWVAQRLSAATFEGFCQYLANNCQCIKVTADTQDIAFMMFEPLNSTNEPLTAFEVYRSKLIRSFRNRHRSAPDLCKTAHYLECDSIKREEVARRSDNLSFVTAQAYSGRRPQKTFLRLKRFLDDQVNEPFVERLEQGSEFLEQVWGDQSSPALVADEIARDCIRFLKASAHPVVIPVLLRYYYTNSRDLPEVAKSLAAFFALWRSAYPTNKLPEVYRPLLSEGDTDDMSFESGRLKSCAELRQYLRAKLEARIGQTPTGSSGKDVWINLCLQNLQYGIVKAVCRFMIFVDLGATLKANLRPNDTWTALDDIEHVLPASAHPTTQQVDAIGNLTFLPPEVNRSLQDIDWHHKREAYRMLASASRPGSIQTHFADGIAIPPGVVAYLANEHAPALAHLDDLAGQSDWGESQIQTRGRRLVEVCWQRLYEGWLS